MIIKCQIDGCGIEVKDINGLAQHLLIHKDITPIEYYLKYINPTFDLKCPYCDKEKKFKGLHGFRTTCGDKECVDKSWKEKLIITRKNKAIKNGTYKEPKFECPICGEKFTFIKSVCTHVGKKHKDINGREYYLKYVNPNADIMCPFCKIREKKFRNSVIGFYNTCGQIECKQESRKKYFKEHGTDYPLKFKEVRDKSRKTLLKNYGVDNPSKSKEICKKRTQKFLDTIGFSTPFKDPLLRSKAHQTRKRNGTCATSQIENKIYDYIKSIYPDAVHHYRNSTIYNQYCGDIFIPSINLMVEVQGHTSAHGHEAFNPTDMEHLNKVRYLYSKVQINIKESTKMMYENFIDSWIRRDPHKRELSIKHGFKLLEIFQLEPIPFVKKQIDRVLHGLDYKYTEKEMQYELMRIKYCEDGYDRIPNTNKIIISFQPFFYSNENCLWNNPIIRRKIIANRMKYLNKMEDELTDRELLRGFKISGIHYGFSHFSPFWIKQFIKEYNIKSIYDPCGGWGHRILGAGETTYIYNDINTEIYNGVKLICEHFNLKNKSLYNNDATLFIPEENYECVFTCPPYYDIEDYGNKKQWEDYKDWIKWFESIIDKSVKKEIKYFAFVMTSKYTDDLIKSCMKKGMILDKVQSLGNRHGSHFGKSKYQDTLIIFKLPFTTQLPLTNPPN